MSTTTAFNSNTRVLVGFDGSAGAHDAVNDLGLAALPGEVEALVVCVANVPVPLPYYLMPGEVGGVIAGSIFDEARAATERENQRATSVASVGAALLSKMFPRWKVRPEAASAPVYLALVEKARQWTADLVVVGSHSGPPLGHIVFGSVSQNVLAHAPCSVRVGRAVPSGKQGNVPQRILLAIDGSPGATVAAQVVGAREWLAGSSVRVVTVIDPRLSLDLTRLLRHEGELGSSVNRLVHNLRDRLNERGTKVSSVILAGDSKKLLLHEAKEWGADCIFLGAHGHSNLERFLIGSVSASVAVRAHCSVEVVRVAARVATA